MKQNAQVRFKRQRILKALELALAGRKITDPSDRVSEKKKSCHQESVQFFS